MRNTRRRTVYVHRKRRQKRRRLWLVCALLLVLGLALWGIAVYVEKAGQATGTEATPTPEATFMPLGVPILVYDKAQDKVITMDLEMYTFRAVSAEMPAGYDLEALKAQAVASRTLAVYKMEGHPSEDNGAAVCTDPAHCQAYADETQQRAKWGADYDANCAKLWQAVNATRGEIAAYGGSPIEVFFHSTSGGITEDAENVFSHGEPYLVSVSSTGEESAPRYRSTVRFTREQFAGAINSLYPGAKLSAASLEKSFCVKARYASGRVQTVASGGVTLTGQQVRSLFSLNSTNFTVSFTEKEVVVETLGYGHGVGMSQVGANAMAQSGSDYKAILTHYYQGVQIQKAYP